MIRKQFKEINQIIPEFHDKTINVLQVIGTYDISSSKMNYKVYPIFRKPSGKDVMIYEPIIDDYIEGDYDKCCSSLSWQIEHSSVMINSNKYIVRWNGKMIGFIKISSDTYGVDVSYRNKKSKWIGNINKNRTMIINFVDSIVWEDTSLPIKVKLKNI